MADFPSTGRYRILVLTSFDLLTSSCSSARALAKVCEGIIPRFPAQTVELVVLHPLKERFEWTDIPSCVKEYAEMSFYGLSDEDAYHIYGVSEASGALAVVRPDGVVGAVAPLDASDTIQEYLAGCLISCSI